MPQFSAMPKLFALAALVAPVLGFCGSRTRLSARAEEGGVKLKTFGYFGETGPENWVALDTTNNGLCATGTHQSPINMVEGQFRVVNSSDIDLEIPDQPAGIELENVGLTVEGIMEGRGGRLQLGGIVYEFKQFHIHHPAEHVDNGTSIDMEVHHVFESADGQLAAIGVYVEFDTVSTVAVASRRRSRDVLSQAGAGAESTLKTSTILPKTNAVYSNMLETVFQSIGEVVTPGSRVTTAPLVFSEYAATLKAGNFQAYSGSLTTPPCSEGVNWMVATQKLKVSPASLKRVVDVVKFNSRFTQNALGEPNILAFAQAAQSSVAAMVAPALA